MSDNDRDKKPWCKKHKTIICIIIIAISMGIALIFLEFSFIDHNHFHSLAYLTAALVAVTGVLAAVAYKELNALSEISRRSAEQLKELSSTARTDFLMRIDRRYSSEEILKAREIIAEIKRKHGEYSSKRFQNEMKNIKENKDQKKSYSKEYVYLLNLLDLLETISYLCYKDHITPAQIHELFGNAIKNYQIIFKCWLGDFNAGKDIKNQSYPHFPDLMKGKKKRSEIKTSSQSQSEFPH